MKVVNNEKIILYLNKNYIKSLDLKDKEIVHKYLKKLLLKLQENYKINLNGYYDMNLYIDKYYGIIVEVIKEELEYLDYFNNTLEFNAKIFEDTFLYQTNKHYEKMYQYQDGLYLKINKPVSELQMAQIIEHTNKIIYGKEAKKIINKAKEVTI